VATKAFLDEAGLKRYDTKIKAKIRENTEKIATLNGDSSLDGSVKKTVADEIAKVVGEAPESLDTLKEVSDWISSHSDSAAAMNTQITENKSGISSLNEKVNVIEEDSATIKSDITNIKGTYSTKAEVEALSDVYAKKTDVNDNYATKSEIDDLAETYLKQTDAETIYAKKTELTDYVKQTDIDSIKEDYVKKSDVIDNLTSTSVDFPLSANQGKTLSDKINEVEGKLCKVYDPVNEITYTLAVENGLLYLDDGKD